MQLYTAVQTVIFRAPTLSTGNTDIFQEICWFKKNYLKPQSTQECEKILVKAQAVAIVTSYQYPVL